MDIEEVRSKISQMGTFAGQGLEKNTKLFYSLLTTLNGSGLVASLAFIGTIISSKLKLGYVPFYWCVISFGIGLTIGVISLLCNYLYFKLAVSRYEREYLSKDLSSVSTVEDYIPILSALSKPTCGMQITSWLNRYLPALSTVAFAAGLCFGIYYINILKDNF